MAIAVATLSEALATLGALEGLLVEVHAHMVFPIAHFREFVCTIYARQNLIQSACLGVQLVALDKHPLHSRRLAHSHCLITRLRISLFLLTLRLIVFHVFLGVLKMLVGNWSACSVKLFCFLLALQQGVPILILGAI